MFIQAAGFALLAAVSPTALLVMAVYLGSAEPRRTALLYVTGAVLMSVVMAVGVLILIRATGLNQPRQHTPRYGLRLGLGLLTLAGTAFVALRRRPLSADPARPQGFISRLAAQPAPVSAFVSGLVLFAPSVTFIAAIQVVATAQEGVPVTAVALVTVVAISAAIVWLPLAAYLAAPDATARRLKALNGWLRAHGRMLLVTALLMVGIWLVTNGALGLLTQ